MHVALALAKHLKQLNPPLTRCLSPHADSVVTGIIITCVALLFLITLMVTGYCVIRKHDTVKEAVPVVPVHVHL